MFLARLLTKRKEKDANNPASKVSIGMKMNKEISDLVKSTLSKMSLIKLEEIPNIDLYMDQVTTFMDEHLQNTKRYEEDKTLTKTMINNYAKSDLLPPPIKKKYTKDHMLLLILIYYFKNILSINDTKKILHPISEKYFNTDDDFSLEDIYKELKRLSSSFFDSSAKDVIDRLSESEEYFSNEDCIDEEEKEFLKLFSYIISLCFDIYVKKQIVENLIDTLGKEKKD